MSTKTYPVVNGTALTSLDALEEALSYMDKEYNDAAIHRPLDGKRLIVRSRYGNRMEHFKAIKDSSAVEVISVGSEDGRPTVTVRETEQ